MTSATTPISASTEQEHYQNDNQDQFHGISPLMAAGIICRVHLSIQRRLQSIVPDKRATPQLALRGVSNFAQCSPGFKRAIRRPGLNSSSMTLPNGPCSRAIRR